MKDLNLIELTDLEKRYGKKEALTGINLTIGTDAYTSSTTNTIAWLVRSNLIFCEC